MKIRVIYFVNNLCFDEIMSDDDYVNLYNCPFVDIFAAMIRF